MGQTVAKCNPFLNATDFITSLADVPRQEFENCFGNGNEYRRKRIIICNENRDFLGALLNPISEHMNIVNGHLT